MTTRVDESGDREHAALREMGRRSGRIRAAVGLVSALAALGLGGAGYVFGRAWQLEQNGVHSPWLTAGLFAAPPVFAVLAGGRWLAGALVRSRRGAWVTELAQELGLAREELEQSARMWS